MSEKLLKFKKIDGTEILDVAKYLKEYIHLYKDNDINIMIGCDSLPKYHGSATYTTVVAIHKIGKGAHLIYNREHKVRVKGLIDRLWEEVERSIRIAQHLKENGVMDMKNVKSLEVNLHLDINPDESHDSNAIYKSAIGYVTSMGFSCNTKPEAPAASFAADHLCRGKEIIQ